MSLGGTYNVAVDPTGSVLYLGMNAAAPGADDTFGEVVLVVVELPPAVSRRVCGLLAAAVLVAACSSDRGGRSEGTAADTPAADDESTATNDRSTATVDTSTATVDTSIARLTCWEAPTSGRAGPLAWEDVTADEGLVALLAGNARSRRGVG